jgi:hypothetical protein
MAFDRETQYGTDTMSRGAANAQALTYPFSDDVSPEVFESFGDEYDTMNKEAHPATGGNPLSFVFILIGLIVAMFIVHRTSAVIREEAFGVNWVNFLQVGVMSTFFILLIKAVFGRYHVRGITSAVAAI